jgi:pimeloyl-ACP methyl ester carboxylesterase
MERDAAIGERTVRTNGIELNLAEAGPPGGRPVLLLHGFPD